MTVRTVAVKLIAEASKWVSEHARAGTATRGLLAEVDNLAKKSPERFNQVAMAAGAAGLAMVAVAGFAVKTSMAFDKEMSNVSAVANASVGDMDRLRQAALDAGKASVFTATEAAQAEGELAKAGIKTADILGGALTGSLTLASAGQMGLADAATISAQAMNIFHLSGSSVTHIADVLAAASNKSAASMQDLGDALRQGGLVASQAGLSLEDTTGMLAAFADRALIGSDAGTSLKTMLQQLAGPSEKSASLMQQLGIEVYDASGNFIGATKLAGLLQAKLGGLDQATRDYAFSTIFGSDATRAATVLYNLGEKGIQGYIDAVNDSGAAAKTAAEKTNNLAGDVERLKGSLENLAIEAGSGANGGLRTLVKITDELVSGIGSLPGPVLTAGTVLVATTGGTLLAAAGFLKARQTSLDLQETLSSMGPIGAKAGKGIGLVTKGLGYLAIAAAAVAITLEVWSLLERIQGIDAESLSASGSVEEFTASLLALAKTGKTTGKLADLYGQDLGKLKVEFEQVKSVTDELAAYEKRSLLLQSADYKMALERKHALLTEHMDKVDQGLSALVQNGNPTAASLALRQLSDQTGLSVGQLLTKLPLYSSAAANAALANTGLAKGFASADAQGKILAGTLNEAVDAGQTLTDVWNSLHGALLSSDKAMLAANQAIDAVSKSFKENGKAIEGNSTAALENRIKIEEVAQSAAAAAQKTYELASATKGEEAALRDATTVYDGYIAKLREALTKQGLAPAVIDAIIASYTKMPALVATKVATPGAKAAKDDIDHLHTALNKLPDKTSVGVVMKFSSDWSGYRSGERANRWGGLYEHAATGLLREASVYSAQNPGRYMIAEPETGGEGFVPKNGDYGRSMSIISQEAAWYGASVVPGGASGWKAGSSGAGSAGASSAGPITVNARVFLGTREITDIVRVEVDHHERRAGKRADVYARS